VIRNHYPEGQRYGLFGGVGATQKADKVTVSPDKLSIPYSLSSRTAALICITCAAHAVFSSPRRATTCRRLNVLSAVGGTRDMAPAGPSNLATYGLDNLYFRAYVRLLRSFPAPFRRPDGLVQSGLLSVSRPTLANGISLARAHQQHSWESFSEEGCCSARPSHGNLDVYSLPIPRKSLLRNGARLFEFVVLPDHRQEHRFPS